MTVVRIVADPDGQSRFSDDPPQFGDPFRGISLTEPRSAIGAVFRRFEPSFASDWHPSGMRELAVMVSGTAEYEVGTGEVRTVGPGDVLVIEDTSGRGHRSRNIGLAERIMLVVALGP